MQINILGQSLEHWASDVNIQKCINMYPELVGEESRSPIVLSPTPGLSSMVEVSGAGQVRELMTFGDSIYALIDDTVYKLTVDTTTRTATANSIGSVSNTSGPAGWARNLTQIFLLDSTDKAYIITPATDTLAEVTDPDFLGANSVVFLDSFFIYSVPNTGSMYATDVEDGFTISALDTASAESNQDNIVALLEDKQELWVLGERTVEIWYNAANPTGFPLSRRQGAHIDQGCSATASAIKINNGLMWLDDRRYVVMTDGYDIQVVSTPQLNREFSSYDSVSTAKAYAHEENGHLFYVLTFPSEQKTWVYDLNTGMWHERAYFNSSLSAFEHHLAFNLVKYQGLNICGARNSGNIYVMAPDLYDDNGDYIRRVRTTAPLNSEFKFLAINDLEVRLETGQATSTGAGSDPQISLRYSNDGGHTWSNSMARSMGKIGEYNKPIRWNRLGTAREWIAELSIVEPIKFTIIDASVNVEVDRNG